MDQNSSCAQQQSLFPSEVLGLYDDKTKELRKVSLEDGAHFIGVGLGECFSHPLHSEQQHSHIAVTPFKPESISLCLFHPRFEVEGTSLGRKPSPLQPSAQTRPRKCQHHPITSAPVLPSVQLSPLALPLCSPLGAKAKPSAMLLQWSYTVRGTAKHTVS